MRKSLFCAAFLLLVALNSLHLNTQARVGTCIAVTLNATPPNVILGQSVIVVTTLTNVCNGGQTVNYILGANGCEPLTGYWLDYQPNLTLARGQTASFQYTDIPLCAGIWDYHLQAENRRIYWILDKHVEVTP